MVRRAVRRLASKVTAAGVLVVLVLGMASWSVWQRWDTAETSLTIANMSGTPQLVRLTDATSGRSLGTVRVEDGTRALVALHRQDIWWRDLTIPERAAGADRGIRVELLDPGCSLLAMQRADHWQSFLAIQAEDGLLTYSPVDGPWVATQRVDAATAVMDPCGGRQAPPVAVIQNLRTVPVVLEGRIRVEACTALTVREGDAARTLPASMTAGTTPVQVPSLAIQKGRWPLEMRVVTVGLEVDDFPGSAFPGVDQLEDCGAAVGSEAP